MSLLDFMNTDEARMGLGLLAAAGPRSDGAGFGQRMMEGIGYADQYKAGQQKSKYLQMQMDEAQAKMEQEKAAREMLMRKQAALPGLFTGGRAGLAPLVGDAETGILPSMGRASTPASLDVQKALMAGYTPDEIGKLDGLRNIGRNEVARTMKGMVNGREVDQQYDKYGGAVGSGMEQYKAPIEMSTGASKMLLDPFTRQPLSSFKMEQSPDSKASNQLGWANNALSRERMTFDKAGGAEGGKPQLVDGQWVYKPDARNPQGRVVPVLGMADKPFTDSQGKANLFGTRMIEAEKALKSVAGTADRPGWLKRTTQATVGLVPFAGDKLSEVAGSALNFTQSSAQQQVEQAKEDFINALMRRESGAVIGRDEFSNADRQYFPQVGDSDAKIAQKERNRKTAINGIMAEVPRSRNGATGGATGDFGGVKFLGFE